MRNSSIEWTDDTHNPIRVKGGGFYCIKVSEGCKNCYAETVNNRFFHQTHKPYKKLPEDQTPELVLDKSILLKWVRATKSRRVFVSSMTDIFGEFVEDEMIFDILKAMTISVHRFQVLTKRADRMHKMVNEFCRWESITELPKNIMLIVSCENQHTFDERSYYLEHTKCSYRGISFEPLLGEIYADRKREVDWYIIGGESGRGARPINDAWVYALIAKAQKHEIPVFFKQWGAHTPEKQQPQPESNSKGGNYILLSGTFTQLQNFPEGWQP